MNDEQKEMVGNSVDIDSGNIETAQEIDDIIEMLTDDKLSDDDVEALNELLIELKGADDV